MKVAHALIASIIALTSLHTHAADAQIEASSAQQTLKLQYAELEDLKSQLALAKSAGTTNVVTFVISSGLVAAGLIMDILGGPGTRIKNMATLSAADTVIVVGGIGMTSSGLVIQLDENKIEEITKKITDQQTKITETAQGLL
jgi:uncharacterized membrane protein